MRPDVRDTPLYADLAELYRRLNEPLGQIGTFAEPSPSPDGTRVAFTGTKRASVEVDPVSRVCVVDLASGEVEEVTGGPHDDKSPRWSPDGRTIAFLSDRRHRGRYALYLLEAGRLGEAWAAPEVPGSIEWLSWSPDGASLLLGVAGLGAEKAGAEGSGRVGTTEEEHAAWLPDIGTTDDADLWRRAWRYDAAARTVTPLSREGLNVWEAAWCGPDRIAAILSEDPGEDAWYDAPLALVDVATGRETVVHRAREGRQLGWPAATTDGGRLAVVEAWCSDRWLVSGEVLLVEDGAATPLDTGVDVTHLAWRDDTTLTYVGARGFETVTGAIDVTTKKATEHWAAMAATAGWVTPPALLPDGTYVSELSAWDRPAQVAVVGEGIDRAVHTFGTTIDPKEYGTERVVTWQAPDGLTIQGLLYEPAQGEAPYATVLYVHGGPIAREQTRAPSRQRFVTALLSRGYAVLVPNVRGSAGRGQDYAAMVVGDMGGGETGDHLSGLQQLVEHGVTDPERIGVMGGSHGGFMTTWLVTQAPDTFAAAVAISPVTDWRSQHYTSNIAHFDTLFVGPLGDPVRDERSPLLHADKVKTPTFLTAGEVDRCTPPGQALEFHQALRDRGVPTACAVYPGEGHGVRRYPAILDWNTRILGWFEQWMPAKR